MNQDFWMGWASAWIGLLAYEAGKWLCQRMKARK